MQESKTKTRQSSLPDYVPTAEPTEVPRFDVDDPKGYKYLEENGYVVFKEVATEEEIKKGRSLAWDFLEGLKTGIKREDPKTYDQGWPDPFGKGIVAGDGVGQSEFLWFCRGLPKVQKIYSTIWETDSLITSFDGFCIMRPFEYNSKWKTKDGKWYHLDQNGWYKPDRICVQGLLNFYEAGLEDGGLVVVPKSHTIFSSIFKSRPKLRNTGDFIPLTFDRDFWTKDYKDANLKAIKPCAKPGDFLLWDSRTIHCNTPATKERPLPQNKGEILPPRRLVAYVCMTPSWRLNESIKSARINAYRLGLTTSHWPEDCLTPSARKNSNTTYNPVKLDENQKKLIPL